MLKYHRRTTNTGNSVADYTESYFKCDVCNGNGSFVIDKKDLIDRMEGLNFSRAIYMYRQWKSYNGKVDCANCEGSGEIIDRS